MEISTMSMKRTRSFGWRLAAVAAVAALGVTACRDDEKGINAMPVASGDPAVALQVSSLDAAAGDRVAVAVLARGPGDVVLHGLQGTLRFNADRLRYVGQSIDEEHPVLLMVND